MKVRAGRGLIVALVLASAIVGALSTSVSAASGDYGFVYLVISNDWCPQPNEAVDRISGTVTSSGFSQTLTWDTGDAKGASGNPAVPDVGDNIIYPRVVIGGTSEADLSVYCKHTDFWTHIPFAPHGDPNFSEVAGTFYPKTNGSTCWLYTDDSFCEGETTGGHHHGA